MPGINSAGSRYEDWEMEYDHYQHYFYDDHDPDEDFFKSTAPSEDIWKKFELVPTPPMSPIRTLEGSSRVGLVCPSLGDKLEWVSQFLGQDDEQDFPCKLSSAEETFGNLSSIIIQDCMWSGFSASQQLEKVVGERLAPCPTPGATKLALQTGPGIVSGRTQCVPADLPVLSSLAADCVDPAAVLTFPLPGACKKQVSSGSESHTDSSDEDDDDDDDEDDDEEEEDEEEIDVVTVEQQNKPRRLVSARQPVTITVRADPLDPCMKRFHISIHQQQHNYAAPSPDTLPPFQPSRKRVRHEPSRPDEDDDDDDDDEDDDDDALPEAPPHPRLASAPPNPRNYESGKPHVSAANGRPELPDAGLAAASPSLGAASSPPPSSSHPHYPPFKSRPQSHPSSPQSSDGEDTDKRKTHNFLERKRRNDLRSRFLSLRDEIPGLAECPKTPKVAILTQATEYLRQLHASERLRAQERRQLKARQQQLLRRLAQLKRS